LDFTLGEKLGPLLFQFGYFNKKAFVGVNDFLARLRPFLKKLPKGRKFAVEIRNKNWLVPQFVETLRERNVALALVDHVWLPRPKQLFERFDPITTDFTYVRWLGDRKGIEEQTKTWDRVIVDRSADLAEWVEVLKTVHKRKIQIYGYANNHYAGIRASDCGDVPRPVAESGKRKWEVKPSGSARSTVQINFRMRAAVQKTDVRAGTVREQRDRLPTIQAGTSARHGGAA